MPNVTTVPEDQVTLSIPSILYWVIDKPALGAVQETLPDASDFNR